MNIETFPATDHPGLYRAWCGECRNWTSRRGTLESVTARAEAHQAEDCPATS
jgi:hypothetical protein